MGFDPFPKLSLSLFMCKRLMSPCTRETCEKMAGEQPETIVEEREELMVPLTTDPNPTLRTAHFLKPSLASINQQPLFKPPSLSSPLTDFEPGEWPLKLVFTGWIDPQKNWKTWVDQMHPQHQSTWRKAGINEAIMCSTYKTRRNHDLFWGLAERWCPSTNSFIFPWGETTITLEDIIVLGGFSVIGEPVSKPLETTELMKLEENLLKLLTQLKKTLKSCHQEWMKRFMGKGSELEHIAFLSLWLSRYVFGQKFPNAIGRNLLSVAIHLARGTRLALGPAVLASIYRDLSLLKETIIASTELRMDGSDGDVLSLALQAPLRLVQIWAWERFPGLRPEPNAMNHGEPRIARWHGLKRLKIENVRMVLDSAQDCFQWRPYATTMSNWSFPKFYIEKEEWMVVDPYLDQELQSFAQCLRVCELVGIDCIELYLPHRVAMQFGIDQDLPCTVTKSHESPETAWSNYGKPIWNAKLYVPSRLFEGDVTTQYLSWWKQSTWPSQAAFTGVIRQPRSLRRSRRSLWGSTVKKEVDDNAEVPPGFLHKYNMVYPRTSESYLRSSKGKKGDNDGDVPRGFGHRSNLIHQIEKTMQNEAVPRCSEGAAEAANESDVYNTPKMNDNEGQNRSYKAVEIPGLELEARISRLERVIAELKAERLAARLTSITKQ
ncbi:uncharacterized protein LOC117908971 [Vitis riparia]|uniref:uncharacterized protein LOC117908971 n=1 Tax=Vitis riparia TaxID=96939 RepID=UPI00155AA4FA|nr:uncharacterized protein LOC117908971 [Vitis riparia]